jgi:hypothetical protein
LYVFGSGIVWVVVGILVVICGSIPFGCWGYEWEKGIVKGRICAGFVSKNVSQGCRIGGKVLAVRYGSVLGSVFVREYRVDFCCDVVMDVDLESAYDNDISWGCNFVYYALNESMVVDIGGMICRDAESFSSSPKKLWSTKAWFYGLYTGVMMENVISQPSLYCIYKSYDKEIALEGRIQHQWSLLPLGLHDFMLGFSGEVGCVYARKPFGVPYASSLGRRDYWYYGTAFCLIYKLATGEARVGISYEGNAASKSSWVNRGKDYKNNVWFNASLDFSF